MKARPWFSRRGGASMTERGDAPISTRPALPSAEERVAGSSRPRIIFVKRHLPHADTQRGLPVISFNHHHQLAGIRHAPSATSYLSTCKEMVRMRLRKGAPNESQSGCEFRNVTVVIRYVRCVPHQSQIWTVIWSILMQMSFLRMASLAALMNSKRAIAILCHLL